MSVKQDRTGVRTAVDLERKYNFGKTFAEMLGLINDSRDKVDSVESSLRNEIKEQATTLKRDTEQIVATATESVRTELNGDIQDVSSKVAELELNADEFRVSIEQNIQKVSSDITNLGNEVDGDIKEVSDKVAELELNADEFRVSIEQAINGLENRVEMKVDASAVNIAIDERFADGIDSVTTSTGYTFNSDGLTIKKSGNAMKNTIDNTGMYVTRSGTEILTANKDGVNATNLHARTYLIIGRGNGLSRFEDYGTGRTGCFWIGGE